MSFVSKSNRSSRKRKSSSSILTKSSSSSTNSSHSNRSHATSSKSNNFLSQLETLRSFVGCGGEGTSSFSEQDLSTCLRDNGYDVQRAAEALLTGAFTPSSSSVTSATTTDGQSKKSSSKINSGESNNDDEKEVVCVVSPLMQKSPINTESYSTNEQEQAPDNKEEIIKAVSKEESRAKFFQPHKPKKKRNIITLDDNNESSNCAKTKCETLVHFPKVYQTVSKRFKSMPSSSKSSSTSMKLLLCRRWIVAFSTSRNGIIQYHEPMSITSSSFNTKKTSPAKKKQCNIVRFKGERIEGTLDTKLGNFIAPLMNCHMNFQLSSNDNDNNTTISSRTRTEVMPLIDVEAKGLMYDDQIRIGSEIPLEISIYIANPQMFFALFGDDCRVDNSLSENATKKTFNTAWFHSRNGMTQQSNDHSSSFQKAAFDLLQWAHYGDVPLFDPPKDDDNDGKHEDERETSTNNDSDNFKDGSRGTHNKGSENIDEISKEKLMTPSNDENVPDWAQDVFSNPQNTPNNLDHKANNNTNSEEESDPLDLNAKGVHLRPYQRQALHWMMHRENDSNSKINSAFEEQLEFLSDLASEASTCGSGSGSVKGSRRRISQPLYIDNDKDGVQCELGPVLVSKDIASKSLTLDRIVDPICHPLWRKRFLWDVNKSHSKSDITAIDNQGVYSFYVNELLQTASKTTPSPPKECCGGILADSMGLGKTVMLLSLISKDKELRFEKKSTPSEGGGKSNEEQMIDPIDSADDDVSDDRFCTLVVTPLSLLPQWEEEIASKTSLNCQTCYGESSSKISLQTDLNKVDVLLTTYGTIQSEFINRDKKRLSNSKLLDLTFHRVILDEGHLIKNPSTVVSKACCSINAKNRWCVTGTPIVNSLHDVFGLLKFLKHEPWCESSFWKNAISRVFTSSDGDDKELSEKDNQEVEKCDGMKVALGRVRRVLNPLLLRRTKETIGKDGNQILCLPPIERKIVEVELTGCERHFYNALLDKSQTIFEGYLSAGTASKSWFAIFSLLQRLRQACDHLSLTVKSQIQIEETETLNNEATVKNNAIEPRSDQKNLSSQSHMNDEFLKDLLTTFSKHTNEQNMSDEQQIAAKNHFDKVAISLSQCMDSNTNGLEDECSICLEVPKANDIAITPCSHVFCSKCLLDSLKIKGKAQKKRDDYSECPFCAVNIRVSSIRFTKSLVTKSIPTDIEEKAIVPRTNKQEFDAKATLEAALQGKQSSKISAILKELDCVWEQDAKSKVIIFSQYLGMLTLIGQALGKEGITSFKLDGKMSLNDRRATLKQFNSHSIETCGLGHESNACKRGSVLLASMKACGVGLNLVAASTVFIVDPWWNDAMEDQCINRIHRIGQMAPIVRMRKFIVMDSVEEKIVKMQERKKGVASEVLSHHNDLTEKKANPTLDDFRAIFGR